MLLAKAALSWKEKRSASNATMQWKERLWRFKAFVAARLCEAVQGQL
jgi:hypothetical protein